MENSVKYFFSNDDVIVSLKKLPKDSVDLIVFDPPYNIDIAEWDKFENYSTWALEWIKEAYRVLKKSGNMVIFGGTNFSSKGNGDLYELVHAIRTNTKFRLVNTIIWHYKNGISAKRFFANRHEEIVWFAKTSKYFFDLDAVREKYDTKTEQLYLRDKRLNPENVVKGKNPTNVWDIGRLNGNSLERVGHVTQKPYKLILRLILGLSPKEGIVVDPFSGSGVTVVAGLMNQRNVIASDISDEAQSFLNSYALKVGLELNSMKIDEFENLFRG